MTERIQLSDLPDDIAARISQLDRDGFELLATQARCLRDSTNLSSYPTDPSEAASAALKLLNSNVSTETDEPMLEISSALEIACLVLGRGEELDKVDCAALWHTLNMARELSLAETERRSELSSRLRRMCGIG